MHRTLWVAVAAVGYVITSGCSMCESYLDYDYPAYGGRWCWEADDCCRAGSAFCHAHHDGPYDGPHGEQFAPTQAAPPNRPTDLSPPQNPSQPKELTPPSDLTPPSPATPTDDLTPPRNLPDTGLPPIDALDLPPLRDLDLPPLDIDGAVPDLPPQGN